MILVILKQWPTDVFFFLILFCRCIKCDWASEKLALLPHPPLSLRFLLCNDQHAEGRGGGSPLACWPSLHRVLHGNGPLLYEGGPYGFCMCVRETAVCVFLISYTHKISVIYAARLSPYFRVALVFSQAACQSVYTGSPCITDERGKKPVSEPGLLWFK